MATTIEYDIRVNAGGAERTLADIENELHELNEEIKDVDVNSAAFKRAAKNIQALEKELEGVNNEIAGLQFEDKLQAADGAAKVFAGSLASVVGTLGVLGVESEVFGEFEEKAASAIAVGLGIKDVSEGFVQFTTVMKKSGVAAKLFGSTVNRALLATGIGAFIVALGTIIAYWDDITEAVGGASKETKDFLKQQEAVTEEANAQLELLESQEAQLKLQGKTEEQILQMKIAQTDEIIAQLELQKQASKEVADEEIKNTSRVMAFFQSAGFGTPGASLVGSLLGYDAKGVAQIAQKGQEQIDEIEKQLNQIREKRAQYLLALNGEEFYQTRQRVETVSAIETNAGVKRLETKKAEAGEIKIINLEERRANDELINKQIENQQKLDAARQSSLDNVIAIAGAETAVGKAAFIAKQILAAKELIMEAKNTVTFATLKGAEATAATATGAAKTAAVGFPQNIPLLIAYAAQAAGIIAAVVSAVKGAKSAAAEAGAGGGGGLSVPRISAGGRGATATMGEPTIPTGFAPEAIGGCQSIRAYVVGGDVTSTQEADAKLNAKRTLG